MYKVIIKGKHGDIYEVCRSADLHVAKFAYHHYLERGFTWVLVNQQVGGLNEHWVSRLGSPAVMKGE